MESGLPTADARERTPESVLVVRDLGRIRYADAFALQKELHAEVIAWRAKAGVCNPPALGHLLLVEHDPPVITVSRRKTARQHLIATPQMLEDVGVEVAETDRGGDITYHGPGQLVVYPILDLNLLGVRLHGYMRFLEDVVIRTLAHFGLEGHRDESATGVWVAPKQAAASSLRLTPELHNARLAKICAMGVRVSRWVSMHGLALNVATNLDHFNLIIPCGLAGRSVTSMHRELGETCPSMDEVKRFIVNQFVRTISAMTSAPARVSQDY